MKIAVPTEGGLLSPHFGHCSLFTIVEADPDSREIKNVEQMQPPPHERGVIPAWLNQLGCTHIIAGGIGQRAVILFQQAGVEVVSGAAPAPPEEVVRAWLNNRLGLDANPCQDPAFRRERHGGCQSD